MPKSEVEKSGWLADGFNVICGYEPVKHSSILRHCRTRSGNLDHRNKSGDDTKAMQFGRSMIEMLGVLAINSDEKVMHKEI